MFYITSYLQKRERGKIRAYMRGFRIIKEQDKLEYVAEIKNRLADITISKKPLKSIIDNSSEICFHQFLVYRLLDLNFNKALLMAISHEKKYFFHPLPDLWRKALIEEGFKIPIFRNHLLWIIFNIKWYIIGILTGILELIKYFPFKKNTPLVENSAFFENLYPNTLVKGRNDNSQTILDWFCKQDEARKVKNIYHNCRGPENYNIGDKLIIHRRESYPTINSLSKFLKFIFWLIPKWLTSIFVVKQRLILRELVFEKLTQLASKNELDNYYFFHNSGHIFRPLWTYEVDRRDCHVIFYFYSTNISTLKEKGKNFIQEFHWQVVSWPHYWVWNKQQLEFLNRNTIAQKKVTIKGVIPFTSSIVKEKSIQRQNKNSILIFDVQPKKKYTYCSLAPTLDFYSEENTIHFLNCIDELANSFNLDVYIKRKRHSDQISKRYLRKIDFFVNYKGWCDLDPGIDADYACKTLDPVAAISAPFTSTAIISKKNNIPSIYFDPTEKLDKDFKINNGIQLASTKKELKKWFESIELERKSFKQ